MRVTHLVTDLELGGTPLRVARLARALNHANVQITVGALAPPGPVSAQLEAAGIATFACNARGQFDLGAIARLRRHLAANPSDLLHAHLVHANVAARLVAPRQMPVVTSTVTIEVERRWHAWAEWLTQGWDRAHIVTSPALKNHVTQRFGTPPDLVYVVPPLIAAPASEIDRETARATLGVEPKGFLIAWAGRCDRVKRVPLLLEALRDPLLRDARLVLAGDGPERTRWEARASRLGVGSRVRFLGWLEALSPVYAAADVFALPSRTEGTPNALLEACAAGCPAVISDLPAYAGLIPDGLPIPRVAITAGANRWAAALAEFRQNPAKCAALAGAGRTWATQFTDADEVARRLIAVYEQVLARR
jgi:glycosyltransferase involved in cell wall biosynthesis